MMQKNETAIVTIEDIGVNGEGIGKIDGYTLFIKDAVIGDVVEAKVMKAKKKLWLRKTDEDHHTIERSCDTSLYICKKMWRMSDSGNVI